MQQSTSQVEIKNVLTAVAASVGIRAHWERHGSDPNNNGVRVNINDSPRGNGHKYRKESSRKLRGTQREIEGVPLWCRVIAVAFPRE
jgi:hypothetical protein